MRQLSALPIASLRNYALLVFFLVMVGGIVLKPGSGSLSPAPIAERAVTAGLGR
ncbi:hypothetical protein D3C83_308270 [compost metagenome]